MLILLVVPDNRRRKALAALCAELGVRGIACTDAAQALFAAPPGGVNLVLLDPALQAAAGPAGRATWHRLAPAGVVLMLDADPARDAPLLREEVRRQRGET